MSSNKAIQSLQKQNDSIFASLIAKNIQFERIEITNGIDEQEHLRLLGEENAKLKDIVKVNKPPSQAKEVKPPPSNNIKESKPKEKKEECYEGDEGDEVYEEPIKKFDTITNMEDMKRAFFNGDYTVFEEQLKLNPFKLYKVGYKYNSDKNGVPEFSAKNLLKGFVRNFDDYRKYFMICFRCLKLRDKNEYKYDSFWIVNSGVPVQNIIGSVWEDFDFEEATELDGFIEDIKKIPETDEPDYINGYTCIGESYVH